MQAPTPPPSLISRLIPAVLRLARMNRIFVNAEAAKAHLAERALRPRPFGPPHGLRSDVEIQAARRDGWPVYTLVPRASRSHDALIYLHGGGWVNEIVSAHWRFAARLASEAGLRVVLPIYPLAPFGTAREALDGVVALVLAERERSATREGRVFLAGDSAGGQIALSAALALRDRHGIVLPRTVLIAPALDLSLSNPRIDEVQPSDPWLGREGTRVFIEHWRGMLPVDDPCVSPLAGELTGLGPITLFSGTRDILHPDARLLVEKARQAGVTVDYCEGSGLVHVYPLTPTREGRAARAAIVAALTGVEPPANG